MWEYMAEGRAGEEKQRSFWPHKKKRNCTSNNANEMGSRAGDRFIKHDTAPASNVGQF